MHRLTRAAAATLLALTAAGCGSEPSGTLGATVPDVVVDGPVVSHPVRGDGGFQALITGPLERKDGCLLVGDYPVVWPHGTTWDEGTRSVRLADGVTVAVGDVVRGGGGYPHLDDLPPAYAAELADCPLNETQEIASLNSGGPVTVER